jgi:hypothetical protein
MPRNVLTKVKTLGVEQRQCCVAMNAKLKGLAILLKSLRTNSQRAIEMLGQLQNIHETCLSVGNVVCSKVQHAVALDDADSFAVAGSVAAIQLATENVTISSHVGGKFLHAVDQLHQAMDSAVYSHKRTGDLLEAMCNTHDCAIVIHAHELEVIESETTLACVTCKHIPGIVNAAHTEMCNTCLEQAVVNYNYNNKI